MPISLRATRSLPPLTWPTVSRFGAVWGVLALATLAMPGCGGGGGGGGGGSSSGPTVSTSGIGFPIGLGVASPTAVSGSTLVAQTQSDWVRSIAQGETTPSGTQLNADKLFQDTRLQSASCYSPSINYESHDDGAANNVGTLNAGGVALWRSTDGAGQPCSVAQLNTQLAPVTEQLQQGMLISAALRRAVSTSGSGNLPDPGATRDLRSALTSAIGSLLVGVSIDTATVAAASDASLYTYRVVLRRGTGASAETVEVSTVHTPNDTAYRYAGVIRLAHGHLSSRDGYGCTDQVDAGTGLYKVSQITSLGYNRFDDQLSTRLRAAHYCGLGAVSSSDHFANVAESVESGELDPTVSLSTNSRGSVAGWRRDLIRLSSDWNLATFDADHVYGWQVLPSDGAARLFAIHASRSGSLRTFQVFHAFGDDLSTSDGTLLGMYCNWNGPNANARTMSTAFQTQNLSLNNGSWSIASEARTYGPTHACQASTTMRYDASGTGTLVNGLGASSDQLDRPTGGRTDVLSELVERGYWPPLLF